MARTREITSPHSSQASKGNGEVSSPIMFTPQAFTTEFGRIPGIIRKCLICNMWESQAYVPDHWCIALRALRTTVLPIWIHGVPSPHQSGHLRYLQCQLLNHRLRCTRTQCTRRASTFGKGAIYPDLCQIKYQKTS